jgi:hypothetical protein
MTGNYRRRIATLFLVVVMISSPFATAMAGASGPSDVQTVNITDDIDAWAGSPLTLQTQTDGATTINDVPEQMSIRGALSGTPELQPVRIFNPGKTVEFSYGMNSPFDPVGFDLNENNTQVHIIKLNESVSEENVDASMIPGTPSELGDLLSTEDVNSNATFNEITSEVNINDEFNFDHQFSEPGLYSVLITSNAGADSGIQLDADENIKSIDGEVDVIGLEPVAVQSSTDATVSLKSSSGPGGDLTFDVESGFGSDTNHVVAVYKKDTVQNESIELTTPNSIDETTSADDFDISSNVGFVSGEAVLEDDVELLGQTLGATSRNDGPFTVESIINRIASETSTEPPEVSDDEVTLFASTTGVVGSGNTEVTVNTLENWDEGDYRVVYMATSGDSSDEFASAERTITIDDSIRSSPVSGGQADVTFASGSSVESIGLTGLPSDVNSVEFSQPNENPVSDDPSNTVATYLEITPDSAVSEDVDVEVGVSDSTLTEINDPVLLHYQDDSWKELDTNENGNKLSATSSGLSPFAVAEASSSGGGSGGSSGGSSGGTSDNDDEQDDTTQDDTPTVEDVREELDRTGPSRETTTEIIDNDPDTPGVTVTPEGTQSVRQITFQDESASGTVTVREYDEPPESLSESVTASLNRQQTNNADSDGSNSETQPTTRRARVVSVSDISPDSESANGPATIVKTVDRDRFENPENAIVYHERGETWEELPTNIEDAGDGEVTVTAETDSFSLFAVAEVTEESQTTDGSTEDSDDGDGTTNESGDGPGAPVIIGIMIVLALIAAVAFAYNRQSSQQGNDKL